MVYLDTLFPTLSSRKKDILKKYKSYSIQELDQKGMVYKIQFFFIEDLSDVELSDGFYEEILYPWFMDQGWGGFIPGYFSLVDFLNKLKSTSSEHIPASLIDTLDELCICNFKSLATKKNTNIWREISES